MNYDHDDFKPKLHQKNNLTAEAIYHTTDDMKKLAVLVVRQVFIDIFNYLEGDKSEAQKVLYTNAFKWILDESEDLDFWCKQLGLKKNVFRFSAKKAIRDKKFRLDVKKAFSIGKSN